MRQFQARWYEPAAAGTPARVREARVPAANEQAVAAALGIAANQLLEVTATGPAQRAGAWGLGGPRIDLRLFSQELAVLLRSGIALLEALQTLREKDDPGDATHPLDAVMAALRDGQPISAALAEVPDTFDALFIALVSASERSGQLESTLTDHAAYLAWSKALRSRLQAALVYPLMLLAAGGAVVLFLLLYVLPRFAGVFDGLGRDLPAASRWLIDLGVLAAAHPVGTLALALGVPLLALLASRSAPARHALTGLLWRSPGLGPRLRLVALARLYRALALTLSAGVPVPTALALVEGVLPVLLRAALQQVQAGVRQGLRLSACMQAQGLATPVASRMLVVGERSGELATMLGRAAAFHDDEIARLSDLVSRLVNPVLMLVMGVVIGGIVVLMYLPIFTLMEQVQ